jgi:hypothetical protein
MVSTSSGMRDFPFHRLFFQNKGPRAHLAVLGRAFAFEAQGCLVFASFFLLWLSSLVHPTARDSFSTGGLFGFGFLFCFL